MRILSSCLMTAGMLMAFDVSAKADTDYPTRTVTIVAPYSAGGGADVVTRMLAQHLSKRLNQPFVVDNRVGGGGVVAARHVAQSEPDGYTLFVGTDSQFAIQINLRKSLPYDPLKDFIPVGMVGFAPFGLVVNAEQPIKSVKDLVAAAKSAQGKLTYGSSGVGGASHLITELFMSMTGTKMTHVPYKGGFVALTDVAGGHVPLMFSGFPPMLGLVDAGKLRLLAVTSKERVPQFPKTPTVAEAGVPGFEAVPWVLIGAPAGTPAAVVEKLHAALQEIQKMPEVKDHYAKVGYVVPPADTLPQLRKFVQSEVDRWESVMKEANLLHSQ